MKTLINYFIGFLLGIFFIIGVTPDSCYSLKGREKLSNRCNITIGIDDKKDSYLVYLEGERREWIISFKNKEQQDKFEQLIKTNYYK